MGLDVSAKGLFNDEYPESNFFITIGYSFYGFLMRAVARAYYGEYMGALYEWMEYNPVVGTYYYRTVQDVEAWNLHCKDELDVWLFHADDKGKFTPKECRGIYNAIKGLRIDDKLYNEQLNKRLNEYLEQFKAAFKHCAKRRVNLYYG